MWSSIIGRTTTVLALAIASAGLVVAVPAVAAAGPSSRPAASAAPVSRIFSATQRTCLDVSTTDPAHYFLDTYGHRCNGTVSQAFAFQAVPSGPAGTYEITSQATGKCLSKYRYGLRQSACTGTVPPDPTIVEWTLQQVGTTGHHYRFVWTPTVGSSTMECVQVNPTPNGYPGPLFSLTACSTSPDQVLTLSTAP